MNKESHLKIGSFVFHGWKADVVGTALIAGLFFGGFFIGCLWR